MDNTSSWLVLQSFHPPLAGFFFGGHFGGHAHCSPMTVPTIGSEVAIYPLTSQAPEQQTQNRFTSATTTIITVSLMQKFRYLRRSEYPPPCGASR
ncbi:hypothetical protein [Aeromonas sp. MdU4]|uniref:hypothetical protein n=1 Tax=Aeromonas sp. MdU4 TaxID=3342819 RepID=UPI0035B98782